MATAASVINRCKRSQARIGQPLRWRLPAGLAAFPSPLPAARKHSHHDDLSGSAALICAVSRAVIFPTSQNGGRTPDHPSIGRGSHNPFHGGGKRPRSRKSENPRPAERIPAANEKAKDKKPCFTHGFFIFAPLLITTTETFYPAIVKQGWFSALSSRIINLSCYQG